MQWCRWHIRLTTKKHVFIWVCSLPAMTETLVVWLAMLLKVVKRRYLIIRKIIQSIGWVRSTITAERLPAKRRRSL